MRSFLNRIFGRSGEAGCDEVQCLSSDYLEEELAAGKQSAIQFHLSKCGPCEAFVETLASTIGLLSRLPRIAAPPGFKQAIIEKTSADRDNGPS